MVFPVICICTATAWSLADFAKIVDVLDTAKASFVSITQSFNTTTSMGRLTLNMLLSFAQFEREVTGEAFPGEHEAIVPEDLFQTVQNKLKANASGTSRRLCAGEPPGVTSQLQWAWIVASRTLIFPSARRHDCEVPPFMRTRWAINSSSRSEAVMVSN